MNVRVASRVAERLKKLGNFKKIPEMLGFDVDYPAFHPNAKFWRFLVKNCKKSAVTHSKEKLILPNFGNFSPIFCLRLQAKVGDKVVAKIDSDKKSKEIDLYCCLSEHRCTNKSKQLDTSLENTVILMRIRDSINIEIQMSLLHYPYQSERVHVYTPLIWLQWK